jgi:hypothetical protein
MMEKEEVKRHRRNKGEEERGYEDDSSLGCSAV